MSRAGEVASEEQAWNEQQLAQPVLEPAWRLWEYREPSIVLGCSQRGLWAHVRQSAPVPVLLRSAGGGAVLTGAWMLGLSVVLPAQHRLLAGSLSASYRWLGELLASTLQRHRIRAIAAPPDCSHVRRASDELSWACFAAVAAGEVAVRDRKIAGLAQRRRSHGALLAGGLLLDSPDWPLLCTALRRPADEAVQLTRRTTSWAAEAGAPAPRSQIARELGRALNDVLSAAS